MRAGRRCLLSACVVAATALARPAAAKSQPAHEPTSADQPAFGWERPFAVNLHLALGGPFAFAYEVDPVYFIPIEVGVNVADGGPQLSAIARLRLPVRSMAFGFGAGFTRGPYKVGNNDCIGFGPCASVGSNIEYSWNAAVWTNCELSVSRRTRSGLQFRLYGGFRKLMNTSAAQCSPIGYQSVTVRRYCAPSGIYSAYLGFSVGYAFFL